MKIKDFIVYEDTEEKALSELLIEISNFIAEKHISKVISISHNIIMPPSNDVCTFCGTALVCYND